MIHKLAVVALGLLVSATAWADLPPGYRVEVITENDPPLNVSANGTNFAKDKDVTGVSTEILRAVFKRAGINYRLTLRYPWSKIYLLAKTMPNYGIYSINRSDMRNKLFKWVGPLSESAHAAIAKRGSNIKITGLQSLASYKVGTYKGDYADEFLNDNGIPHVDTLDNSTSLEKLMNGEIDIWVTRTASLPYFARREGVNLNDLENLKVLSTTQQYLALNLNTPDEVVNRLNNALKDLERNGTVDKIRKQYAEKDPIYAALLQHK